MSEVKKLRPGIEDHATKKCVAYCVIPLALSLSRRLVAPSDRAAPVPNRAAPRLRSGWPYPALWARP